MAEPTLHQKMDALRDDQIRGFDVLERDSRAAIRSLEKQTASLEEQTASLEVQTRSLDHVQGTLELQNQALLRFLERMDER